MSAQSELRTKTCFGFLDCHNQNYKIFHARPFIMSTLKVKKKIIISVSASQVFLNDGIQIGVGRSQELSMRRSN